MKMTFVDEDQYKKQLIEHYNSILHGRLMRFNTETATDEDLLSFIVPYEERNVPFDNCCSRLEIGEIATGDYNAINFKFINFIGAEGNKISINLSQFLYGMSKKETNSSSYDPNNANHKCTVDSLYIDPEQFFNGKKGQKIFYIDSFECVTLYNKTKRCYNLAYKNITPIHLKNYIRNSQINGLKEIIKNPSKYIPGAQMRVCGETKAIPLIINVVGNEAIDIANNIFDTEFKEKFLSRLKEFYG